MTSIPIRYRLTCLAILLVSLAGCRAFDRSSRGSNRKADLIPGVADTSPKELNAREAAKVCAATARNLEEHGDQPGAIVMYERARLKDPKGMKAVCRRLAVLYDRAGNYQKAQREYELALELSPKDPELLNNLGYCHYCRGKWQPAEDYFRQAIAADKRYDRAWINLGLALGQQQKYDDALAAFQNSVSEPESHCNLAFIYLTQGKREEAKESYRRALQIDPSLEIASYALARIDQPKAGDSETAIAKLSDSATQPALPATPTSEQRVVQVQSLSDQNGSDTASPIVTADLLVP